MELTAAEKNYILAIHRISNGERVSTNQLASEIGIAAASVTDMVQKLAEKEFVRYEKYKGVSLLPIGVRVANQLSNTKELWRVFLSDHLQLSDLETDYLLDHLQQIQSPNLVQRLQQYLNRERVNDKNLISPSSHQPPPVETQPHTEPPQLVQRQPIRDKQQNEQSSQLLLSQCNVGEKVYLVGLADHVKTATPLFEWLHLPIGTCLLIKTIYSFDRSILLAYQNKTQLVSQPVAEILIVKR